MQVLWEVIVGHIWSPLAVTLDRTREFGRIWYVCQDEATSLLMFALWPSEQSQMLCRASSKVCEAGAW